MNTKTAKTLISKKINKGSKTAKLIKKTKKLAKTVDKGINSGGKIPCLSMGALTTKELVAASTALEKNIQGIIATSTKNV